MRERAMMTSGQVYPPVMPLSEGYHFADTNVTIPGVPRDFVTELVPVEESFMLLDALPRSTATEFIDSTFPEDAAEKPLASWLGDVSQTSRLILNTTVNALKEYDTGLTAMRLPAELMAIVTRYNETVTVLNTKFSDLAEHQIYGNRANHLRSTQIVSEYLARKLVSNETVITPQEVVADLAVDRPAITSDETMQSLYLHTAEALLARPVAEVTEIRDDATVLIVELHMQSARAMAATMLARCGTFARTVTIDGSAEINGLVKKYTNQLDQIRQHNVSASHALAICTGVITKLTSVQETIRNSLNAGAVVKGARHKFPGLGKSARTEAVTLDKDNVAVVGRDLRTNVTMAKTWLRLTAGERDGMAEYITYLESQNSPAVEVAHTSGENEVPAPVAIVPEVSNNSAEVCVRCDEIRSAQTELLLPFNPSNKKLRADGLIAQNSLQDRLRAVKDPNNHIEPAIRTYAGLKALIAEYGDEAGEALEMLLEDDAALRTEYTELIGSLSPNVRPKDPLARDIQADMEWLASHWQNVQTAIAQSAHEVDSDTLAAVGVLLGLEVPTAEEAPAIEVEPVDEDVWTDEDLADFEAELAAEEAEKAELDALAREIAAEDAAEKAAAQAEADAAEQAELAEIEAFLEAEKAAEDAAAAEAKATGSRWTAAELAELEAIAQEERLAAEVAANEPEPTISAEDQALIDDAHLLLTDIFNPDRDMSDEEIVERGRKLGDRPGNNEDNERRQGVSRDINPARVRDFAELIRTYNVRPDVAKSKKLGKEGLYYLLHVLGDDGNGAQEQITIAESLYDGNGTFVLRGGLIGRANRKAVEALLDDHRRTTLKKLYRDTGALVMHAHTPNRDHRAVVNATVLQLAGIEPPVQIVRGTYLKDA